MAPLAPTASILVTWLVLTLAVIAGAYVLPGVRVTGFVAALVTALVLGIINALVRPALLVLTLPINALTLGLFTFVINALLIMLAAVIVPGFEVDSFWSALLFSIVLAIIIAVLAYIF
ncbi:phage holin family protein [Candidatus Parcubacteria bacterium]|nr:MAG: phage holin family protein [Candidatus Parcubacteria bacterium]